VKEEQGPLRLCGEGRLAEVICAVVLMRTGAAQFHLGLRRSNESHEPVLHLAFHRFLRDQPFRTVLASPDGVLPATAIALCLDPAVNELLRVLARRVAKQYANDTTPIAYGFGEPEATFDQGTAQLTDPDAAFTCATFVLAMLRSVGIQLIDAACWRAPTEEDLRWQRDIGDKLLDWIARRFHGDLVRAQERLERDRGSRRYRPQDVAGASLLGPETWPVGVDDVDPRAAELAHLLAWPTSQR
jgi:hypothetical protein